MFSCSNDHGPIQSAHEHPPESIRIIIQSPCWIMMWTNILKFYFISKLKAIAAQGEFSIALHHKRYHIQEETLTVECCLQGQLCGLCVWFWPSGKMRMILRIIMMLQKWHCKMTLQKWRRMHGDSCCTLYKSFINDVGRNSVLII